MIHQLSNNYCEISGWIYDLRRCGCVACVHLPDVCAVPNPRPGPVLAVAFQDWRGGGQNHRQSQIFSWLLGSCNWRLHCTTHSDDGVLNQDNDFHRSVFHGSVGDALSTKDHRFMSIFKIFLSYRLAYIILIAPKVRLSVRWRDERYRLSRVTCRVVTPRWMAKADS